MLVPLAENVEGVAQNLIVLEFRLGPVGRALLDLERVAILQVLAEAVDGFVEDAVGLALMRFVGANLIDEIVEHVAKMHGVQHAEAEIDGEFQPGLARCSFDAVAVFKEQHAEAVEAGILQREAILGLIHAEAAGPQEPAVKKT